MNTKIFLSIIISFLMAMFGFFMEIGKGARGGIFFAYWFWSWVWGLKLLYPAYVRRVKSHRFSFIRAYGYFFYGAFYISWAGVVGPLGGGIYKFIVDLRALVTRRESMLQEPGVIMGQAPSQEASKTCPKCAEIIKLEALVCHYCGHKFDEAEIMKIEKYMQAKNYLKEKEPKISKMKLLFRFYRIVGGFFLVFGGLFVIFFLVGIFKKPEVGPLSILGILSCSSIVLCKFTFGKANKVRNDYMKIKEEVEELAATGR